MARVNDGLVAKRKQHLGDRPHQHLVVAARKIRAPDRTRKQRIADEQIGGLLPAAANLEADSARAMAGRVVDLHDVVAERDRRPVVVSVDGWRLPHLEAEHRTLLDRALVEEQVVLVQVDRRTVFVLDASNTGDVVDVRVREQDQSDVHIQISNGGHELIGLVAGIDDRCFARALAADDEAVLVEGWRPRGLRGSCGYNPITLVWKT